MIQFKYHIALTYGEQPVRKVKWRKRETDRETDRGKRERENC